MNWAGFQVKDKLRGIRPAGATLFQSGFFFNGGQFAAKMGRQMPEIHPVSWACSRPPGRKQIKNR
ncbi:MAG TPA: hypothetical protein DIC22_01170 [Chitinophagaceae bacterium]|jgi:hypothetical protein|nr:hypothetical protein [Chitinophagaceae bacterium]